ncbi:MAG: hypothetical protein MH825_05890 [Cyanobacteria bacterium]|nr:hypothetical protein [Cyanobacteriota bacterium]
MNLPVSPAPGPGSGLGSESGTDHRRLSPWISRLGLLVNGTVAIAAALGIATIQQGTIAQAGRVPANAQLLQEQTGIKLDLLQRLPALGFENCIANWAFLSYLQYFGDTDTRTVTGYDLNRDYFRLMVQRDPRFLAIYPFLSAGVSYYQGEPETAIALMATATDSLDPQVQPEAFWVWRFMALDRLLLLGDGSGAAADLEMAARWANQNPRSQPYVPMFLETARFFRSAPDSRGVQFFAWNSVYTEAVDEPIKRRAARELILLGAQRTTDAQGQTVFVLPD